MIFLAQRAISLLDITFRRGFVDVEELIEVFGAEYQGQEVE